MPNQANRIEREEGKAMPKSVVSIVKGTDPDNMVEEALTLLGGVSSLIKPGSTVVIKTNSILGAPRETSICTSPEVLVAVIKELRKARPKEIILTEGGPGTGLEWIEGSGQKKAAEEAGVDRIVNTVLEKDLIRMPIRDHRGEKDFVLLPRFLVEADHFVNVPKFKTHVSMMFTASLKNPFGLLQFSDRAALHHSGVSKGLMDLWSVCKADLQIVDMIRPGEGYGPLGPIATDFGCIVAGKDPVAVDSTCCRMVGMDITKVPYFEGILDRHLGNHEEKMIEVRGKKVKDVFKRLWTPYLEGLGKYPEYNIHRSEGACALCEGLIAWSLERMKPLNEYDKNAGVHIVFGRAKELPKGVKPRDLILFGNCIPEKFRDQGIFCWGCPPWEFYPAWPIMDRTWYDDYNIWPRDYINELKIFWEYQVGLREKAFTDAKQVQGQRLRRR
jgi:uncharacterized protein (DUF362 family)